MMDKKDEVEDEVEYCRMKMKRVSHIHNVTISQPYRTY